MVSIDFQPNHFRTLRKYRMISIIIPAHNEKDNLKRLLCRLSSLSIGVNAEVIVALSSSNNDRSENINTNLSGQILKCSEKGRASQMNAAVKKAQGDILVFLHADVIPPNSFFQDINTTLKDTYDAGFFSYRFDKDSFLLKINASFTAKDGIFTGGGDQCLFIKKAVFLKLGGFDERQVLMEDFEFFDRMKKSKIPYKIINNDLIVSARKYKNNSYFRVNISNVLLLTLYKLGYPSKKLKMLSMRLLKAPYQTDT